MKRINDQRQRATTAEKQSTIKLSEAVEQASLALVSDLEPETLLQRIVELARELVSAQYGALAVLDQSGRVQTFITSGVTVDERGAIGTPPQGLGLLGALYREGKPIRITSIGDDPRSVGFPTNHPLMTSFLGVPILLKGRNLGNLYLANKQGAKQFSMRDEQAVVRLARFAAVAIENAHLHREAVLSADEWRLLAELARQTASSLEPPEVFKNLVDKASVLMGTDSAFLALLDTDGQTLQIVATSGINTTQMQRLRFPVGQGLGGVVMQSRTPVIVEDYLEDSRIQGKQYEAVCAEGLVSHVAVPFSAGGQPLGVLYVANRRRTAFTVEQARRLEALGGLAVLAVQHGRMYVQARELQAETEREKLRLQTVIESIPESVLITDSRGETVVLANRAAMKLFSLAQEEKSISAIRLYRPDGTPLPREEWPLTLALKGVIPEAVEVMVERQDQERAPLLARAAPLCEPDGNVTGTVLIFSDISHVKEAEKLKEDFLAMITHDLRTPLATIKTIAASLSETENVSTPIRSGRIELGKTLDNEVDYLTTLVTNLLDMSRIQAGTSNPEPEECHILDIAQEALRELELAKLTQDHTVSLEISPELPQVYVDFEQVRRVLTNLISNALKYSRPGTPVRVLAKYDQPGKQIVVTVEDHGIGIPPEELLRIFEKFYRRVGRDSRGRKGTGLGLAISKALVEQNGGRIWAESAPGVGSRFYFTLPMERRRSE